MKPRLSRANYDVLSDLVAQGGDIMRRKGEQRGSVRRRKGMEQATERIERKEKTA